MSKLLSRIAGFFSSRTMVGADKVGNRYFIRKEEVDGIKRPVGEVANVEELASVLGCRIEKLPTSYWEALLNLPGCGMQWKRDLEKD
ncbi:hypothetical protein CK203_078354 [Vitis vinifera]|uniref:Uncharacterized protein n=1 Tax=Vitis vinifera TaxID=29760 RepID=A0A438DXP4_VITVI|nr:hypothetical protein CK203_078354 [Vitis vinifera]